MTKKKKEIPIEITVDAFSETVYEIPEGTTHVKFKIDYSNCYYSGDYPDYRLIFSKKEKEKTK